MIKENLCDNCGKYPVTTKDCREDDCGGYSKVYSCRYCAGLNDKWHYRVRAENLDPKEVLGVEDEADTWTITVKMTVFAGDMDKDNVISNAESLLPDLLDGTDFTGIAVIDAKRDEV